MGKLSHIADFEEGRPAQDASSDDSAEAPTIASAQEPETSVLASSSKAQAEADFHGLGEAGKMPLGQKALVVLAAAVFIAAVAYVINYLVL